MAPSTVDVGAIVSLGAPVLCFDTCSVLDILRDPTRAGIRAHEQAVALDLLSALETGTALVGLVAEQVRTEFTANVANVEDEATRGIRKLRDMLTIVDGVAAVFGANGRVDLGHLEGHVARSRAVADRWMAAAALVPTTDDIRVSAVNRVIVPRTPARPGKESTKDCVVIETYLDIVTRLRAAGLASRIVFVSSNTRDYAGETGRVLNADLAAEFSDLDMEYAPNLAAARHFLGL